MNQRTDTFDSLIFDMDGTLWDAVNSYCAVWDATFSTLGIDRRVSRDELIECMGLTIDEIFNRIMPSGTNYRDSFLTLLAENERIMMPQLGGTLYPDVREGIEKLAKSYKLLMASNCGAEGLTNFLTYTGLKPYFTDTITYGETGQGKDFNITLLKNRHSLHSPLYIGDTAGDCRSAHAAGVKMMHVTYGFGTAPEADLSASSFAELTAILTR